jgi:ATP-dependent Lon protease
MAKGNSTHPTRRKRDSAGETDQPPNSDPEHGEESDEEVEEFDMASYRKFLSKMFPSKHIEARVQESSDGESSNTKISPKRQGKRPPRRKRRKPSKESPPSSSDEETEDEYEEDDYDTEELEEEVAQLLGSRRDNSKFNIIFTMGGPGLELDEDEDEDDSDYSDEGEDYSSEEEEEEDEEEGEWVEHSPDRPSKRPRESSSTAEPATSSPRSESTVIAKMREALDSLSEAERKTEAGKHLMKELAAQEKQHEKEVKRRSRKIRQKNANKFRGLLKERNVMNDVRFFRDKLDPEEQAAVIRQVEEIKQHCEVDKPYRLALLDADIPVPYKASAYKKLNTLRYMEPGSGEYYKVKQWVDAFMRIPFGKYKNLSLTLEDGVDKCHEFMAEAKQTLDNVVYGLDDAKLQILQMVGQWIANPEAVGNAIAIQGPMGTGKTTLVKDGISKILGRDFAFFALGGATDSSVLEGHSYTYEGSMWGKILDIVIQCGNMNPVIYFDELDKVSDTPKGEEIIGILTHLTDTSQNSKFHDKYFAEIDFDLSRCLFIFSYNDEHRVNPILRDRMYRIQTKGYSDKEKSIIARDYQLPKIRDQVKFAPDDIVIPDDTLQHIISRFTEGEEGVRNLKRCLEIIYTKLNLYRLMKPGANLFEKDLSLEVEFPLTVTPEIVDKLIKKSADNGRWLNMYN